MFTVGFIGTFGGRTVTEHTVLFNCATIDEARVLIENVVEVTYRAELEQMNVDWDGGQKDMRETAPMFYVEGPGYSENVLTTYKG